MRTFCLERIQLNGADLGSNSEVSLTKRSPSRRYRDIVFSVSPFRHRTNQCKQTRKLGHQRIITSAEKIQRGRRQQTLHVANNVQARQRACSGQAGPDICLDSCHCLLFSHARGQTIIGVDIGTSTISERLSHAPLLRIRVGGPAAIDLDIRWTTKEEA